MMKPTLVFFAVSLAALSIIRAEEPTKSAPPGKRLTEAQVKQILSQQRNAAQAQLLLNFVMEQAYAACGGKQFYREDENGWPECLPPPPAPPKTAAKGTDK